MKVKICGLSRPEDIAAVNEAQPDYCGFILNYPKSHRNIEVSELRALRAQLVPQVKPVGVFVHTDTELPAQLLQEGVLSVVQLHGGQDNVFIDKLHAITDGGEVWQAFEVRSVEDVQRANASHADLILLDAGKGGGTAFDWALLKEVTRPFALAGGLHAGNIPAALGTGAVLLDVSSGAETDGKKDAEKIKMIVSMIKGA